MSILNERQIRRIIREEIEDILDEVEDEESTIDEAVADDDSELMDEYILSYFLNVNWSRFNSEVSKLVGEPVKWDSGADIDNTVFYIPKDSNEPTEYWIDIYGKVYGASGRGDTVEYGIIKGFKSFDEWVKTYTNPDKIARRVGIVSLKGITYEELITKYPAFTEGRISWRKQIGSKIKMEYRGGQLYVTEGTLELGRIPLENVIFQGDKNAKIYKLRLFEGIYKNCDISYTNLIGAFPHLENCTVSHSLVENQDYIDKFTNNCEFNKIHAKYGTLTL